MIAVFILQTTISTQKSEKAQAHKHTHTHTRKTIHRRWTERTTTKPDREKKNICRKSFSLDCCLLQINSKTLLRWWYFSSEFRFCFFFSHLVVIPFPLSYSFDFDSLNIIDIRRRYQWKRWSVVRVCGRVLSLFMRKMKEWKFA